MAEKFSVDEVQTKMDNIEQKFDEFGKALDEISLLVESLVENGNSSAIHGFVGQDLFAIWDNNAQTFDTFKANFQNWYEVVQVIAANNAEFAVAADAKYRDLGSTLDGVQDARKSFANGSTTMNDLTTGTTYENFVSKSDTDLVTARGSVVPNDVKGSPCSSYVKDGKKYSWYDESTAEYHTVYTDANGNVIAEEVFDKVRKTGSEFNFDESTGRQLYDAYGNEISQNELDALYQSSGSGSTQSTTGTETGASYTGEMVTYKSGDSVNVNGQNYSVYGGIEKPNGEVVMMYGDSKGNLYYQNENGELENVTYSYTQYESGGVQANFRTVNATVNDLGNKVNGGYGETPIVLNVGDQKVRSLDDVATTITCPNVTGSPSLNGVNNGAYINNQVNITTDGVLKTSYLGQTEGTSVNGSTVINATGMADFNAYVNTRQGEDITLRIPQGQYVQWDSPSGGTGYEFPTGNGAVYLRWDGTAANGSGAYHMVDEYGNVINNKDFTLDGFNNNGGVNGGVWK